VMQVFNELKAVLDTEDVMVVMEAKHLCVSSRGIKDETSFTSTLQYGGIFEKKEYRDDFFRLLGEKNS
jgi:GTP cyclohydrolase I